MEIFKYNPNKAEQASRTHRSLARCPSLQWQRSPWCGRHDAQTERWRWLANLPTAATPELLKYVNRELGKMSSRLERAEK